MTSEHMGGVGADLAEEYARAIRLAPHASSVILVEGISDREAVTVAARRTGVDFDRRGILLVPIAGATNIGRFLAILGRGGMDLPLAGLCDEGEADTFCRALTAAGMLRGDSETSSLESNGFFVCHADLEEELIRGVSPERVLEVMETQGHLKSFQRFQRQPAQRSKTLFAQIWRWLGNHKIEYAPLLVEALDPEGLPPPLDGLLRYIHV